MEIAKHSILVPFVTSITISLTISGQKLSPIYSTHFLNNCYITPFVLTSFIICSVYVLITWWLKFYIIPLPLYLRQGSSLCDSYSQRDQKGMSNTYIWLLFNLPRISLMHTHTMFKILLIFITSYLDYIVFHFLTRHINYPRWLMCSGISILFLIIFTHACFSNFNKNNKYIHAYIHIHIALF